ncbi:MAG: VOC family protein [Thermoplasmatota archaeon]
MFLRNYVRLPANNVPKLAQFYQALIPFSFQIHKSKQYADTDIPGGVLAFFGPKLIPRGHDETPLDRKPGTVHLDVENVDQVFEDALQAGATPQCQPETRDGIRHACILDPDQNVVIFEGPDARKFEG